MFKKLSLAILCTALTVSSVLAERVHVERMGGNGGGGNSDGGGRASQPSAAPTPTRSVQPNDGRSSGGFDAPHHGGGNGGTHTRVQRNRAVSQSASPSNFSASASRTRVVRQPSARPAPGRQGTIVNNTTVVRSIQRDRRVEVVPNRSYWHNDGGIRYVHNYHGGVHWYGFYHGSDFYWTRYHQNRWWWYDSGFNHWVFWSNGYWWWNSPSGVYYVYQNDNYYPYDNAPVAVTPPVVNNPPVSDDSENNGGVWNSPDGKRMVQIQNATSEAFLYDTNGTQPRYLAYLGKNVERVRFSGGKDGRPAKILVDYKNGEFSLYTPEGEPLDMTPPETPSAADQATSSDPSIGEPPTPPSDIPN